jgi:hypothetical protein
MGTATTNKPTLTVTAAPAPPPPPSSGGGGGGAMEEWFVLALLALGATRRLIARRSPLSITQSFCHPDGGLIALDCHQR